MSVDTIEVKNKKESMDVHNPEVVWKPKLFVNGKEHLYALGKDNVSIIELAEYIHRKYPHATFYVGWTRMGKSENLEVEVETWMVVSSFTFFSFPVRLLVCLSFQKSFPNCRCMFFYQL